MIFRVVFFLCLTAFTAAESKHIYVSSALPDMAWQSSVPTSSKTGSSAAVEAKLSSRGRDTYECLQASPASLRGRQAGVLALG